MSGLRNNECSPYHSMVFDLVCFCFVWFGLVWFDLVWFGLIRRGDVNSIQSSAVPGLLLFRDG